MASACTCSSLSGLPTDIMTGLVRVLAVDFIVVTKRVGRPADDGGDGIVDAVDAVAA